MLGVLVSEQKQNLNEENQLLQEEHDRLQQRYSKLTVDAEQSERNWREWYLQNYLRIVESCTSPIAFQSNVIT